MLRDAEYMVSFLARFFCTSSKELLEIGNLTALGESGFDIHDPVSRAILDEDYGESEEIDFGDDSSDVSI